MITLQLTQKQTELIIHSLGSEGIRTNNDSFMNLRDKVLEQIVISRKKREGIRKTFTLDGHTFNGTIEEALQGISGFNQPDILTWCKDNLTEIK